MTNELEKQFFSTFGIKSKKGCTAYDKLKEHEADTICNDECLQCLYFDDTYPCITDRILLELICILNNYGKNDTWAISVENLKDCILMNCIKVIKEKDLKEMSLNNFKHQVRTLFEEG